MHLAFCFPPVYLFVFLYMSQCYFFQLLLSHCWDLCYGKHVCYENNAWINLGAVVASSDCVWAVYFSPWHCSVIPSILFKSRNTWSTAALCQKPLALGIEDKSKISALEELLVSGDTWACSEGYLWGQSRPGWGCLWEWSSGETVGSLLGQGISYLNQSMWKLKKKKKSVHFRKKWRSLRI